MRASLWPRAEPKQVLGPAGGGGVVGDDRRSPSRTAAGELPVEVDAIETVQVGTEVGHALPVHHARAADAEGQAAFALVLSCDRVGRRHHRVDDVL